MPRASTPTTIHSGYLNLTIGGYEFTEYDLMFVDSVRVTHERNKGSTCAIQINDPQYTLMDSAFIQPNAMITFFCGLEDEVNFKGPFFITELALVHPSDRAPYIEIQGKDPTATVMHKQKKSKKHRGKLSEIVTKIAQAYALSIEFALTPDEDIEFNDENTATQSMETDAQFIQRLCDMYGLEWGYLSDGLLYLRRPEYLDGKKLVPLYYRTGDKSIKEFRPKIKTVAPSGKNKQGGRQIVGNIDLGTGIGLGGDFGTPSDGTALGMIEQLIFLNENPDFVDAGQTFDVAPGYKPYSGHIFSEDQRPNHVRGRIAELVLGDKLEMVDPYEQRYTYLDSVAETDGGTLLENAKSVGTNLFGELFKQSSRFPSSGGKAQEQLLADQGIVVKNTLDKLDTLAQTLQGTSTEKGWAGSLPFATALALKQGIKAGKRKFRPMEADLVPTIPSWRWNETYSVMVHGTAKRVQGLYEVHKVELSYDKEGGLSCSLQLKKPSISADTKKMKSLVDYSLGAPLADEQDNSRPTREMPAVGWDVMDGDGAVTEIRPQQNVIKRVR